MALAMANAVLAMVLADQTPDRSADLWILRDWIRAWLQGDALFTPARSDVDYPPWAFVTFALLGAVPAQLVIPGCALASLFVMYRLAFVSAEVIAPRAAAEAIVVPALLVLCWGAAIRTIIVTTPLCLLLGLLAVRWRSSPACAGIFLGLALAKPHVALPFALWACGRGRFRIAVVATAVVLAQLAAFSLVSASDPIAATWRWISNVQAMYTGNTEFIGLTAVRAWLDDWVRDPFAVDVLAVGLATATLAALFLLRNRAPAMRCAADRSGRRLLGASELLPLPGGFDAARACVHGGIFQRTSVRRRGPRRAAAGRSSRPDDRYPPARVAAADTRVADLRPAGAFLPAGDARVVCVCRRDRGARQMARDGGPQPRYDRQGEGGSCFRITTRTRRNVRRSLRWR